MRIPEYICCPNCETEFRISALKRASHPGSYGRAESEPPIGTWKRPRFEAENLTRKREKFDPHSAAVDIFERIAAESSKQIPGIQTSDSLVGVGNPDKISEIANSEESNGVRSVAIEISESEDGASDGNAVEATNGNADGESDKDADEASHAETGGATNDYSEREALSQQPRAGGIPCNGELFAKFRTLPTISGSDKMGTLVERFKREYPNDEITNEYDISYVVDSIQDCKLLKGVCWFRVRWDGYSEHLDTWEEEFTVKEKTPALFLNICDFFLRKIGLPLKLKSYASKFFEQYVRTGLLYSRVPDYLLLSKLANEELEVEGGRVLLPDPKDVARMRSHIKLLLSKGDHKHLLKKFGGKLETFVKYACDRIELHCDIDKWCSRIASKEPKADITIENYVDCEGLPNEFVYVTDYIVSSSVKFLPPSEKSCECRDRGCFDEKCCGTYSRKGSKAPIRAYKRNRLNDACTNVPLYECNSRCFCGPPCENRLIQQGCQLSLTIFRTCNRGWGVRADKRILKGTFIGEYLGELMTSQEAMTRHSISFEYLFDLKPHHDKDVENTVDAARYGNFTRFLNHSCEPNVRVNYAYIENHNPTAPRLAFFAKKDIEGGEELTIDYQMQTTGGSGHLTPMRCHCGASTCREFLF